MERRKLNKLRNNATLITFNLLLQITAAPKQNTNKNVTEILSVHWNSFINLSIASLFFFSSPISTLIQQCMSKTLNKTKAVREIKQNTTNPFITFHFMFYSLFIVFNTMRAYEIQNLRFDELLAINSNIKWINIKSNYIPISNYVNDNHLLCFFLSSFLFFEWFSLFVELFLVLRDGVCRTDRFMRVFIRIWSIE